jgi:hypothetical protein
MLLLTTWDVDEANHMCPAAKLTFMWCSAIQRTELAPRADPPVRDSSRGSGRSGSSRASPGLEPRPEGTARPQAGWGGEPLVTNGILGEGAVSRPGI